MNKLNFDSLNNIKAPEQWIKNAVAIPETSVKKRGFPHYRIAAAASIVLVSVIGLLTFLSFGNHAPIELRDNAVDNVSSTDAAGDGSFPDDGDAPRLDTIFPTLPRVYPTDAAGNPVIETPAQSKATREKPSAAQPTEKGRSGGVTVSPTKIATEPQGTPSTQAPEPTDPPLPTEPPKPPTPTEDHGEVVMGEICFTATFPASLIKEGETVRCMYSVQGYAFPAIETDAEVQYTVMDNGMVYAMYEPGIQIVEEDTVTFEYLFYTDSAVLARGTLTV
ncbi:hypothetical protein [uncultured Ruminococcus sp.]|uniref:hypothetical protein n=1 Tax=uncultured Ruminococcus sp. TaxID=165186 RepID=UPI0029302942|nr:hypothetical protein [uncultured Ruminococcus sp.]